MEIHDMTDKKEFEQLLNEKFGFTVDLPENKQPSPARMHDDVTTRNGKGSKTPGGHPMEKYREVVKAILGHIDTEGQAILENSIDWIALKRLANKHGLKSTFTDAIDFLEAESKKKKPNAEEMLKKWEETKKNVPYWFLGMVGKKNEKGEKEELPEHDKKNITNLFDIMDKVREISGKEFERAAKGTPKGEKTQAEKNLDKARKEHKIEKIEERNKKPENEVGEKKK
jgi:hypothetical protein